MITFGQIKGCKNIRSRHGIYLIVNMMHKICVVDDVNVELSGANAHAQGPSGLGTTTMGAEYGLSLSSIRLSRRIFLTFYCKACKATGVCLRT